MEINEKVHIKFLINECHLLIRTSHSIPKQVYLDCGIIDGLSKKLFFFLNLKDVNTKYYFKQRIIISLQNGY